MAVLLDPLCGERRLKAILGPDANGDVAKQIGEYFPVSDVHSQSELILAGLTLFATTLFFALLGTAHSPPIGSCNLMATELLANPTGGAADRAGPSHSRLGRMSRDGVADLVAGVGRWHRGGLACLQSRRRFDGQLRVLLLLGRSRASPSTACSYGVATVSSS